ncbi:hypothetical protein H7H34_04875 [Stappia sp. 28M-7]|nr:hypothetical protein [Stappia sp. 28M-7]
MAQSRQCLLQSIAQEATLPNRLSVSTLLIIATMVWGVSLWILGIELTWDHAKPYSLTVVVLTSAVWVFDRYLWKIWPVSVFCKRPNLNGTWQATLQSSYADPETAKKAHPIEGYAAIRQTFSSMSIRLMTEQAESFLVASDFNLHNDGTAYIYGVYQSDPNILLRSNVSEIHYGSFKYKVVGKPPFELNGHYWTDRNTNGSIILSNRRDKIFDSYSHAKCAK